MPAPSRITYLGHATVALELAGIRALTDPLLTPRLGKHRAQAALQAALARSGAGLGALLTEDELASLVPDTGSAGAMVDLVVAHAEAAR